MQNWYSPADWTDIYGGVLDFPLILVDDTFKLRLQSIHLTGQSIVIFDKAQAIAVINFRIYLRREGGHFKGRVRVAQMGRIEPCIVLLTRLNAILVEIFDEIGPAMLVQKNFAANRRVGTFGHIGMARIDTPGAIAE